jgi:hypothetical protein
MTRNLVLLATAASIVLIPGVAGACSGNACSDSGYSASASYNKDDKKINAVLTNKSATQQVHLKFCIMIDSRCNPFDVTLPPHGSAMKSVSIIGATSLPKFAVEVSNAEFLNTQATSSTPSGVTAVDAPPYGKITYFANQQASVGTMLTTGVAEFTQARTSYQVLMPRLFKLQDNVNKIPPLNEVKAEVARRYKANPNMKSDVHNMASIKRDTAALNALYDVVVTSAQDAADSLDAAEKQMKAAKYSDDAAKLIAEADDERGAIIAFINVVSAAKTAAGNDAGSVAVGLGNQVANLLTRAGNLNDKADFLQRRAADLTSVVTAEKLKQASTALVNAQKSVQAVKVLLANADVDYKKGLNEQKRDFDEGNATTKQTFQIANVEGLIAEAKEIQKLALVTGGTAVASQKQLASARSANGWMADANQDLKVIQQILDEMDHIHDQAEQVKKQVEPTLARLEEVKAAVMQGPQ